MSDKRFGNLLEKIQDASQAAAAHDWEKALDLYTQALELAASEPGRATPLLPAESEYELRSGRAACYEGQGSYAAAQKDLEAMLQLAEQRGDLLGCITTLNRLASALRMSGDLAAGKAQAERALVLARQEGGLHGQSDRRLQVDSLLALGCLNREMGDIPQARHHLEQALDLSGELDYPAGKAGVLLQLGTLIANDHLEQGQALLQAALALYRQLGDRAGEANTLNSLGHTSQDMVQIRAYLEQALSMFEALADQKGQALQYNNLAVTYRSLGLYRRARDYAQRAVQQLRDLQVHSPLAGCLYTLAESTLGLGDYNLAQPLLEEGRTLAQEAGFQLLVGAYPDYLQGQIALGSREPQKAGLYFQRAAAGFAELAMPGSRATALAWLGAAELALGHIAAAREHTAQAAAIPELSRQFPPQEVWWWRYRALAGVHHDAPRPDEAWHALDRARQLTLEGIANLSDEGLRRNYLNKVTINRHIVLEWTHQAVRRGLALAPFLERDVSPASLPDQFRRLVAAGNRLTALYDPQALPQSILDEFVELSGAERAFLAMAIPPLTLPLDTRRASQATEELDWICAQDMSLDEASALKTLAAPLLEQALTGWQPLLSETTGEVSPEGIPALVLRSVMALPLVSRGRLWGILYGDMRHIFGRFTQADLDLLSLLANQAASALENADWTHSLETLVTERTQALRHSEKRFAAVMDSLSAVMYVADMETYELLFVNQFTRNTFGDVEGELCWQSLQVGQTGPCDFCTNKYLVKDGHPTGPYNWEFQNTVTGRWHYIQDRAIRWIDGRLVRLEVATDITERKQAEAQEQRLAALEERERIGRDLHDDLGQVMGYFNVQAQAGQALLEQGQTASAQAILDQLAQVAQDAQDDVRQYILGIRASRMPGIREARMPEASGAVGQPPPDLVGALERYIEAFRERYGLTVQLSLPQGLREDNALAPEVGTQLLRIVQEALTNVRKHAGVDVARLTLILHKDKVQVVIEDNGRGFDLEQGARDKGQEFALGIQPPTSNLHFGLAIMHERAAAMDGHLEVRSAPGQGTCIIVSLPRVLSPAQPDEEVARGWRVLLADDHPLFLEGLRNMLAARGVQIVGLAGDGLEAQVLASKLRPDLILMDVHMPRCDGLEATRIIKAELPETKIVMLTVAADDEILFEALKSGASGYLLKSLERGQFFNLLSGVMRGETVLSPALAARVLAEFAQQKDAPPLEKKKGLGLTSRQRQVLELVNQGWSNKRIAEALTISESTAKYHIGQILERLQLKSRYELIGYARQQGKGFVEGGS